jgi:hypothetical protein
MCELGFFVNRFVGCMQAVSEQRTLGVLKGVKVIVELSQSMYSNFLVIKH